MSLSAVYLVLAFSVENILTRILFFIVAIWLFIWGYKQLKLSAELKEEQLKKELENQLNEIPHTQCVISDDYLTGLLIDENNENVHIVSRENYKKQLQIETYHFSDILEVALIENDNIQTFISKVSKIQNSILNETKEIKQRENEEGIQKISVKFLVNNLSKSEVEYIFFESKRAISKDSEEYKEIMEICKDWFQKISIIVKRFETIPVRHWE